jgi:hypothetical protein
VRAYFLPRRKPKYLQEFAELFADPSYESVETQMGLLGL